MMLPYYAQNENAPLVYVFRHYNWKVAEYVVSFGAIFGLCASLMGSMFPLPRVVYAMASDGLIFEFLGRINQRFKTPIYGTMVSGILTGLLSAFFNLAQLVNMMSIGTLMAYSMVAACVMLLRFEYVQDAVIVDSDDLLAKPSGFLSRLFNVNNLKTSTQKTAGLVTIAVTLFCKTQIWEFNFSNIINILFFLKAFGVHFSARYLKLVKTTYPIGTSSFCWCCSWL